MHRVARTFTYHSYRREQNHSAVLSISRAEGLSSLSYSQRQSIHFDSDDPAFVDRMRSIARNQLLGKGQPKSTHSKRATMEGADLIIERALETIRISDIFRATKDLNQVLEVDARRREPKWTKEEREALAKPIGIIGIIIGLTRAVFMLAFIGLGTVIWVLSGKPRIPYRDDQDVDIRKWQRNSEANARETENEDDPFEGKRTDTTGPIDFLDGMENKLFGICI